MPPAPTRIASTPRQNSRTCWNPAVPPPPVPGAAGGNELADEPGEDGPAPDGGALEGGALDGGALEGGALDGGALDGGGLDVPPEVGALGVPLAETVGVAGLDPPAENEGGVVGVELVEQADTDAVVSMAKAAHPSTVPRTRRQP